LSFEKKTPKKKKPKEKKHEQQRGKTRQRQQPQDIQDMQRQDIQRQDIQTRASQRRNRHMMFQQAPSICAHLIVWFNVSETNLLSLQKRDTIFKRWTHQVQNQTVQKKPHLDEECQLARSKRRVVHKAAPPNKHKMLRFISSLF
jgi:hypothetical protein